MNLNSKQRQEARIDSRRFSKGVVMIPIKGILLSFCVENGISPTNLLPNYTTGLDSRWGKMLAVPAVEYDNILQLLNTVSSTLSNLEDRPDLDIIENINKAKQPLINKLKQNIALISVEEIPDGKLAGKETVNVIIDSVDLNGLIQGRYETPIRRDKREELK